MCFKATSILQSSVINEDMGIEKKGSGEEMSGKEPEELMKQLSRESFI